MFKKLFFVAIVSMFIISCGNNQNSNADKASDQTADQIVMLTPDSFDETAGEYVGKTVSIEGTVVHVCKHGGKRMFVFGEDADYRVKITTGEDMAAFNTEWEGSTVLIEGIVEEMRIDEEYLAGWEAEIQAKIASGDVEHDDEVKGVHDGSEGHETATPEDELASIEEYRNEIAESGTDHLSYYSIACTKYEVLEPAAYEADNDTLVEDDAVEESEGNIEE